MSVKSLVRTSPFSRASDTARARSQCRLRSASQPDSLSAVALPNPDGGLWRSFEGDRQLVVRIFADPGEPNFSTTLAAPARSLLPKGNGNELVTSWVRTRVDPVPLIFKHFLPQSFLRHRRAYGRLACPLVPADIHSAVGTDRALLPISRRSSQVRARLAGVIQNAKYEQAPTTDLGTK
jgi:hypothetical protein